jgi:hypothetical protein
MYAGSTINFIQEISIGPIISIRHMIALDLREILDYHKESFSKKLIKSLTIRHSTSTDSLIWTSAAPG